MFHLDRAAWIPDDVPDRPWEEAPQLAVDWVEQECLRQGAGAVLVTNTRDGASSSPALAAFARRHQQASPRSRWAHRLGDGTGPVLAYVPTAEALDYAISLARRSSLAVIEGQSFPLGSWARETGAIDLTRPDDPPAARDPLAKALDSLVLYSDDAYTSGPDRRQVRHVLHDLAVRRLLDRDVLLGALAARGTSHGLAQFAQFGELVDAGL